MEILIHSPNRGSSLHLPSLFIVASNRVGPPDRGSSSDSVVFPREPWVPLRGLVGHFYFHFYLVNRGSSADSPFFSLLRTVGPPDRGSSSDLVGFWDEPWVPLGLGGFGVEPWVLLWTLVVI